MSCALHNRVLTRCVLSAAVTSSLAAAISPCPINGEDAPPQRVIRAFSAPDGVTTVAMEWSEWGRLVTPELTLDEEAENACAQAPLEEARLCPLCLGAHVAKAIREGNLHLWASLFDPPADSTRGPFTYDQDGHALLYDSEYVRFTAVGVRHMYDYALLGMERKLPDGRWMIVTTNAAHYNNDTGKWCLMSNVDYNFFSMTPTLGD